MSWAEIGDTTIPQARALIGQYHEVDGSREIAKTIVGVVTALFGGEGGANSPPPPQQEAPGAEVMVDELYDAVKNRMRAEGWTPPSK